MDNNSFTEVTRENWLSRIGGSIKGIFFGIILFIAAFPLLWWNEGRSVERYNSLKEGQSAVISISSETINPENNGKLVHIQGLANTEDVLRDNVFNVFTTAIKLKRQVSMYQWKENVKTETEEKIGGTKETKKTYTYNKDWSHHEINSSHFKYPSEHSNPRMLYQDKTEQAQRVMLGAFKLNTSQISRINNLTDLSLHDQQVPTLLANKPVIATGNGFYLGDNPSSPKIGDMQVSFQVVKPSDISLIAQQQGNSFTAYKTQAGSPIDLLKLGIIDADSLFAEAQSENTLMTWGIRIGGTLLMWMGLGMIFKPLSVFASVLPFLGNLIGMGTRILAFLITLPCAMLTIAFAWIAYRPLLAGILISLAVLSIIAIKFMPLNILPALKDRDSYR